MFMLWGWEGGGAVIKKKIRLNRTCIGIAAKHHLKKNSSFVAMDGQFWDTLYKKYRK